MSEALVLSLRNNNYNNESKILLLGESGYLKIIKLKKIKNIKF